MSDFANTHRVTYKAVRNNWASPTEKTLEIQVSAYDFRVLGEDAPLILAAARIRHLTPKYDINQANDAIIKIEEISAP